MPEPFDRLASRAIVFDGRNVDTDQIIPARFMRTPRSEGYARFVFHDLRFTQSGAPVSEFPFNALEAAGSRILVAGENFGCGSSREAAVYALFDFGIRCVIAPSFGDIFRNNCYKNGLLPIALQSGDYEKLKAAVQGSQIEVDLPAQSIRCADIKIAFDIEPFWKDCLVKGADDIDLTLLRSAEIAAFACDRLESLPWLIPGGDRLEAKFPG
jgi:3-isopropylmalate/(R)-2-methylmalate dehydratase small subunit